MTSSEAVSIKPLPSKDPSPQPQGSTPLHWNGNPATSFKNPWPSFGSGIGLLDALSTRFGSNRNFVPVPETRDELVKVQAPDWGHSQPNWTAGLKATWLGHAGVLVETPSLPDEATESTPDDGGAQAEAFQDGNDHSRRGLRILFDAVFSERTSPVTWAGPKRYTPTPCSVDELPEVDLIVTSHDHYDHMDLVTIKKICDRQHAATGNKRRIRFFAGLGNAKHLLAADADIRPDEITECDWWDSNEVTVPGVGSIELTCTPAQHSSGRGIWDRGHSLWCSWAVADRASGKKMYFAGDTGYKEVNAPSECPAFKQIGATFKGFDLAWVPIGLYSPQTFMGAVHVCPEDSMNIHKDIGSKKTIGMHYGTVRGGLSQYYEDVREPPRRWKEAAEKEGKWGTECGLCNVGETVIV